MISQGEQHIINILKRAGISFQREYSPKDLKSLRGKPMRFDFFIEEKILLEYDSIIHYKRSFKESEQQFKYRQEADLRKNEYCLARGILLYRIPYYDLELVECYNDLFKPKHRVTNKWWNHNIRQQLIKSGEI